MQYYCDNITSKAILEEKRKVSMIYEYMNMIGDEFLNRT